MQSFTEMGCGFSEDCVTNNKCTIQKYKKHSNNIHLEKGMYVLVNLCIYVQYIHQCVQCMCRYVICDIYEPCSGAMCVCISVRSGNSGHAFRVLIASRKKFLFSLSVLAMWLQWLFADSWYQSSPLLDCMGCMKRRVQLCIQLKNAKV